MTALAQATGGLSDVVGWTLIHFIWQGTAIAAVLGLALLLIPRGFARARYVAGCVSLALMLVVPAFTAWQLADPSPAGTAIAAMTQSWTVPAAGGDVQERLSSQQRRFLQEDQAFQPRTSVGPTIQIPHLLPWIVTAWGFGVLLCSLRLAGGWWQARRLVRIGTHPAPERWQHAKEALAARLRLARPVQLLESSRVHVPVVIGWLRPVLLLPPAVLTGLTPQQLEAVLAHELAHVRRHDYVVNLLQAAVETLLFYHPAVWWVSRTVRVEREHCCDDVAVAACGDAVLYARALTAVEALRHAHTASLALAITGSPLMARVRRLLGTREPMRVSSSGWVVAALTALMVSGAGATNWFQDLPVAVSPTDSVTAEAAVLPAAGAQELQSDTIQPERIKPPSPATAAPKPADEEKRLDTEQSQEEQLAQQRERERALAEARKEVREAAASARAALREHRDVLRAARLEAVREVQASVRQALQENREAMRAAMRAVREARPELEVELRKLVRDAAKLSRKVAREARPEIEAEMEQLQREIAAVSGEAAREAAELAAEISREVAREIERAIRDRDAAERRLRKRGDTTPKPPPAPAPPEEPPTEPPPLPPADAPPPPVPPKSSKADDVPVAPPSPSLPVPPVPPRKGHDVAVVPAPPATPAIAAAPDSPPVPGAVQRPPAPPAAPAGPATAAPPPRPAKPPTPPVPAGSSKAGEVPVMPVSPPTAPAPAIAPAPDRSVPGAAPVPPAPRAPKATPAPASPPRP